MKWKWEGDEREVWDKVKQGRINDQILQMEEMWGSWREEIKTGIWWNCVKNNEMRWEMKRFERGKTGENTRREGGETVVTKIWGRKEVEWRNKGVDRGDYSRLVKEARPSNTPSSRDLKELSPKYVLKKWLMEWKRMKGREDERGRLRNEGHWKHQERGKRDGWNKDLREERKWNEEIREWMEEIIQDMSRK